MVLPISGLGKSWNSGFHVYFWRLLIFRWTLYKAEISIKRTVISCTNSVHFIEIPLWLLVLIINLFSLNFTSTEIEGERVNSRQNKRTLAEGKGCQLGNFERTYLLNVPKPVISGFETYFLIPQLVVILWIRNCKKDTR